MKKPSKRKAVAKKETESQKIIGINFQKNCERCSQGRKLLFLTRLSFIAEIE